MDAPSGKPHLPPSSLGAVQARHFLSGGGGAGGGARSSAFGLEPHVALVVDVTFSTDVPDIEKKELGEHRLGGGPVLSRGSAAHPVAFERLVEVAVGEGIPFMLALIHV